MAKQYRIIPKVGVPDILKLERIEYPCTMSSLTLKEVRRALSFAHVYEILADGSEVLLDEYNYHLDLLAMNHESVAATTETLQDVLSNAKEGDMIVLEEGVYDQELTIDKPVIINGDGKAIITSKVQVTSSDVTITGCIFEADSTLTENDRIVHVTGSGAFSFSNNTIKVGETKLRTPVLVQTTGIVNISGNTFEDPNTMVYNWMEIGNLATLPIASGSKFNFNTFVGTPSNNNISLYAFEEGAEIEISGNTFDYSGNSVRISNITSAKVKFIMNNNMYKDTSAADDYIYSGFILFQDYSTEDDIMDFTSMEVHINNLIGPGGKKMLVNVPNTVDQIYYVYDNQDGIITETNQPQIFLS